MATIHALPDVPLSERLQSERHLRQRLHSLEAIGWERLAPLARHMAEMRLVRARGDAGAPVRHLGLEVLREALCRLLSQDDGEGDGELIFRLVVEGADPAQLATERGVTRLMLVEQLRDASGDAAPGPAGCGQGWVIGWCASGHLAWRSPTGAPVVSSTSPSDRRAVHKLRADLRRAGLVCS